MKKTPLMTSALTVHDHKNAISFSSVESPNLKILRIIMTVKYLYYYCTCVIWSM